MELSVKLINNQMCRAYFSLSIEEIDRLYDNIRLNNIASDNPLMELFIESTVYKYIEDNLLQAALIKKDIIAIASKEVRYLSPLKKGRPLIGVALFPKLQDPIKMNLPEYIEYDDEDFVKKYAENRFHKKLRENGFYYNCEIDTVYKDSVVLYDLNYTKDGKTLSSIEDQEFDMEHDEDIDPIMFLNSKVNDIIILDEEQLTSEAVIKKIYDKKVYDANHYDQEKVKKLGFNSFEIFEMSYIEAAEREIYEYKLIDKLSQSILKENDFFFSDDLISFYLKRNNNDLDKAKKQIVIDYLLAIIDIQEEDEFVSEEEVDTLSSEMELLEFNNIDSHDYRETMLKRINYIKIINVLSEKGVINY